MNENLVKVSMPIFEGKKVYNVGVKVNKQQQDELQRICDDLDRPMSYVVRELAMRGLALYKQDGLIKMTQAEENAILRTMPIDVDIVEETPEEIKRNYRLGVGAPVIEIDKDKKRQKKKKAG